MFENSTKFKAINYQKLAGEAYEETVSSSVRKQQLDDLGLLVSMLDTFVYGYTFIKDSSLDTDDEILNWTFVDVSDDLNASHWNIACGFYKAGASCLRNAFDVAVVALYFQIKENQNTNGGYNRFFSEWDSGNADTPNWRITKPVFNSEASVQSFNSQFSCDVVQEAHKHYHYLCNFTHGRPFDKLSRDATNSMNLGTGTPNFDEETFQRFVKLSKLTIAWIGTLWLIIFPKIMSTDPLKDVATYKEYKTLLSHKRGKEAIEFAR